MNSKRLKSWFLMLIFGVVVYFFNIYLLGLYYDGDLYFYRDFYDGLQYVDIVDVLPRQAFRTGSGEPVYGYAMWLAARQGFEHDSFVAVLNTLFSLMILRFLKYYRASSVFIFLVFTNYYFIVLLTGAERLKIAFILIVAASFLKNSKLKNLLAMVTVFAHTQMIAHVAALALGKVSEINISKFTSAKKIFYGIALVFFVLGIFYIVSVTFGSIIAAKLAYYSEGGVNFGSIFRLVLILLIGIFSLKERLGFFWSISAICFFTAITGSDRFQISALAILALNAVVQGCTRKYAVILIMAFFSFKSIGFLYYTYNYGHGFADVRQTTIN